MVRDVSDGTLVASRWNHDRDRRDRRDRRFAVIARLRAHGGREIMRIAYLATHYPFPPHTFIQGEIVALEQTGVEVFPLGLNRPDVGDIQTDLDRYEAARTYHVKGTPMIRVVRTVAASALQHPRAFSKGCWRAVRGVDRSLTLRFRRLAQFGEALLVWRYAMDRGVTAIHAHFGQAPATVAWFTAAFGNDVTSHSWTWSVTIHGWHEFATEDTSDLRSKLEAADLVVCVSDFTRSQLMRIAPPEAWPKLRVVRCGIDFDAFPRRSNRALAVPPVVITTARLSAEKGHIVLIEALACLREAGVEMSARFIGDGPFRSELEAAASQFGVLDLVQFGGMLPPASVALALREADVFCLPTFAEGLPIAIMEAMAVGVPVVTTYVSGIPELVVDGRTGWVVPAGDPDRLATGLRLAVTDPYRDDVIQCAADAVFANHDRARNVLVLKELLESCHSHRRLPPMRGRVR